MPSDRTIAVRVARRTDESAGRSSSPPQPSGQRNRLPIGVGQRTEHPLQSAMTTSPPTQMHHRAHLPVTGEYLASRQFATANGRAPAVHTQLLRNPAPCNAAAARSRVSGRDIDRHGVSLVGHGGGSDRHLGIAEHRHQLVTSRVVVSQNPTTGRLDRPCHSFSIAIGPADRECRAQPTPRVGPDESRRPAPTGALGRRDR